MDRAEFLRLGPVPHPSIVLGSKHTRKRDTSQWGKVLYSAAQMDLAGAGSYLAELERKSVYIFGNRLSENSWR